MMERFKAIVLNGIWLTALCWMITGCSSADPENIRLSKQALIRQSEIRKQKVIRQLQADCDASLQKETYRRVQQWRQATAQPTSQRAGKPGALGSAGNRRP